MAGKNTILRSRLETEHKRLTEELDKLLEAGRPKEERREGSPFGKREEEAAEAAELERAWKWRSASRVIWPPWSMLWRSLKRAPTASAIPVVSRLKQRG